jgi:hypothetical protein
MLRRSSAQWLQALTEKTMRVLRITELIRLLKMELSKLLARITNALPNYLEGTPERANAHINLRNIRLILARRFFGRDQ